MKKYFFITVLLCTLIFGGCSLFNTPITFKIGVVEESVIYALDPSQSYQTTSFELAGQTVYPGNFESIDCEYTYSETSKMVVINYNVYDSSGDFIRSNDMTNYLYPDEGDYVAVVGMMASQFGSLTEMNSFLSERGLSTFSEDGGTTDSSGVCGTTYEGPNIDPQRDSYCQYAYAYRCGYGYSLNSTEVQTYCNYYDAMNDGGPICPYCY